MKMDHLEVNDDIRASSAKRIKLDRDDLKWPTGDMLEIERTLCLNLQTLRFEVPVSIVYNPLEYANETHSAYINKYCNSSKKILFMGMNPGPFGMAQTGVPFGEVSLVRDWLQICGEVGKPLQEHPKRPITGFQCRRREVSGQRFWTFFKDVCGTPDVFFRDCFVHNYCPLMFMTETGKNVTPPELPVAVRNMLQDFCDEAFSRTVTLLGSSTVVAVGKYAEARARSALLKSGRHDVNVHFLMHPSPINPAANKGWAEIATRQLREAQIFQYLTPCT